MEDYIIVFLDANPNRAAVLHQRMTSKDVEHTVWVQTVEETLDFLENYKERLRFVSLDHDLGGETYVHPAREDCGMEVVRWLERRNVEEFKHVVFIVHTWNEYAGPKMVERLRRAGYRVLCAPFGTSR